MADIFISYAREDLDKAQALAAALERQGWSVFWDRTIPPAKTWRQFIGKELHDARSVVVAWSTASLESHWVEEEADDARGRGILVPVLFDAVIPPFGHRSLQAADLTDWAGSETDPSFAALIDALSGWLGAPPGPPAEAERPQEVEDETRKHADVKARPPARKRVHRLRSIDWKSSVLRRWTIAGFGVTAIVVVWWVWPFGPARETRIDEFQTSATSITAGEDVTLTWSTSEADSVRLLPIDTVLAANGSSITDTPNGDVEYTLIAYGPGEPVERRVAVTVGATPPPPRIDEFQTSATSITAGEDVTLTWSTSEADSVRLLPIDTVLAANGSSITDRPNGDVEYTLIAYGPGEPVERRVAVTVEATPPPPGADDPLNRPIWIEAGTFRMGSRNGDADERPVHQVTVSSFWIQEHEVTNREYQRFVPAHSFPSGEEDHPVTSVNWRQVMDYAESRGGSLPTEAQWEFAARGMAGRTYPWGDAAPTCGRANYGNCARRAIAVMALPDGETPEGVRNLAGNVREWVRDWYGDYGSTDAEDPTGPASGQFRVIRGGAFSGAPRIVRAADRYSGPPEGGYDYVGFRVVWLSARGPD